MATYVQTPVVGLLRAEEDAAMAAIWSLDVALFFYKYTFNSEPFTFRNESFQLSIRKLTSLQRVSLSINRTNECASFRSYFLQCTFETTAEDNVSRGEHQEVEISQKCSAIDTEFSEDIFVWSNDELRRCFGDSRVVRLVVTFFPDHPCHLERPNLLSGKHGQLKKEKCRGELSQITKPGVTAIWTLGFPGKKTTERSAHFDLGEDSFGLRIRGNSADVLISLNRVGRGKKKSVLFFLLTLQTDNEKSVLRTSLQRFEFHGDSFNDCLNMERSAFLELFGGNKYHSVRIRIVCSLFQDEDCTRRIRGQNGLSRDFRELFLTGQDSGITIEVEDKKFRGHKLILSSRCPFFANMLKHDMVEKNAGVLKISHYSARDFYDFLLYLYSGKVDEWTTTEKALSLCRIAEEYDVPDLRAECLNFLKTNLGRAAYFRSEESGDVENGAKEAKSKWRKIGLILV